MAWMIGEHRYPQIATFWKVVEDKENYAVVSLGTSSKDKDKNWENSNWGFVRFVGKAYRPELFELEEKDRIEIVQGKVDRKSWNDKETGKKRYPKNEVVTIFAWKKYVYQEDGDSGNTQEDAAPVVEEDDGELPF